jgi:DGQHR domain-containing protein
MPTESQLRRNVLEIGAGRSIQFGRSASANPLPGMDAVAGTTQLVERGETDAKSPPDDGPDGHLAGRGKIPTTMINVAAIRMQQFGVQFYQASLTASDIDKLVRFEVLSYGESGAGVRGGRRKTPSKVNWDLLERRIASNERAYQRQIIRRKIDELVQYYEQCRSTHDLPAIPGAVIISCDEALSFGPVEAGSSLGRLRVPEREGILRAIDGQHRLLALHADIDNIRDQDFTVPAVIFDRLPEDHVVQMFVTINAKHTRLNPSHLVSLSGRQLYRDDALAIAHDVVRALNDQENSPLRSEIKLLGVGRGKIAQAPLAQEFKRLFASDELGGLRKAAEFRADSRRFFVNYFKQVSVVFGAAWAGRKYAIRKASALRAFIRVVPDVVRRLDQMHVGRSDFRAIGLVIAPWGRRIGDQRFETEGAWKRSGTTVESLTRELKLALEYPEGVG